MSFIKRRWGLTLSLVIFIFTILIAALVLAALLVIILNQAGVINFFDGVRPGPDSVGAGGPFHGLIAMMAFSIFLGTAIAVFFSKKALNPIRKIIDATHKVAGGDFSVRLDIKGIHELEELSGSFNKMAYELSTIETLRSDFINNFSHEFKTPIVSIGGFAKLLREDLNTNNQTEYLDVIIAESERLAALSTNILDLTKYENLEIIANVTTFQLDEQLRKAVIQLEPKWERKGIDVSVSAEKVMFTGNSDFTQQIFLNLIDNAVKFTDVGGAITISLSHSDNGVQLTVKDDGTGMDEHTQARIFDKFYQGDTSRAKAGNGLGLAIVKRIVDLCGGKIEVLSEPNWGSELHVWLPLV